MVGPLAAEAGPWRSRRIVGELGEDPATDRIVAGLVDGKVIIGQLSRRRRTARAGAGSSHSTRRIQGAAVGGVMSTVRSGRPRRPSRRRSRSHRTVRLCRRVPADAPLGGAGRVLALEGRVGQGLDPCPGKGPDLDARDPGASCLDPSSGLACGAETLDWLRSASASINRAASARLRRQPDARARPPGRGGGLRLDLLPASDQLVPVEPFPRPGPAGGC